MFQWLCALCSDIPVRPNLQDRVWAARVGLPLLPPSGRATNQQHDASFGSAPQSWHQSAAGALLLGRTELSAVKPGTELNTIWFYCVSNRNNVDGTSASFSEGSGSISDPNVGYPG